ncbi:MAG: histidine--tRNA ligase [Bacteroidia bacterium]
MVRRNYILDTIRTVYQRYGYQQIETPAMENLSTLEGKYGDEGDKLLFRVLDSGDFVEEIKKNLLNNERVEIIIYQIFYDALKNELDKPNLEDLNTTIKSLSDFIIEKSRHFDFKSEEIGFIRNYLLDDNNSLDLGNELARPIFSGAIHKKSTESDFRFYFKQFKNNIIKKIYFYLDTQKFRSSVSEKGLRYDLTVPFARYVVMHQNEITFPFKRYQIQPVWRADRPQKGRYREFYQCDADVIGSDSLLNEVEMIQMIDEVFSKLGIGVTIKVNNRKILSAIADFMKEPDKINEITVALDKLDKLGLDNVIKELREKGIAEYGITSLKALIENLKLENNPLILVQNMVSFYDEGIKGINEINKVISYFKQDSLHISKLEIDITLARGLNYYTGAIIEVKVNDSRSTFTGSLLGGGRYDDLTGIFGLSDVSGVGISFGVDRIYDVMEEMKLFDQLNLQSSTTQVMFVNFGKEEEKYCLKLLQQVRAAGINAELYPEAAKMKKQMSYADDKKIPFVVLVGSEEIKSGLLSVKNMQSGEQEKISVGELIKKIT